MADSNKSLTVSKWEQIQAASDLRTITAVCDVVIAAYGTEDPPTQNQRMMMSCPTQLSFLHRSVTRWRRLKPPPHRASRL